MENNNEINNNQDNVVKDPVVEKFGIPVEENAVSSTVVEVEHVNEKVEPLVSTTKETTIPINETARSLNNSLEVSNNDSSFVDKEKKKWPIILLLLIIILGGLFTYYYFIMTKPINVITKLVDRAYKNVETIVNNTNDTVNSFTIDSTLTFTSDDSSLANYSGLNAKLSLGLDLKNQDNNLIDADIKLKDSVLVNMAMTFADNKMYFDLKDSYPEVVYLEGEDSVISLDSLGINTNNINNKKNDYLYIAKLAKDTILKSVSQERLAKKIMLKDINGKKIPVVEVTYKIDYAEYKKLHNALINSILNDDKALKILAEFDDEETKDVKEKLTEKRDNISELDFSSNVDVTIDIDAFTNKLVYLNAKDSEDEITYTNKNEELSIDINSKDGSLINTIIDTKENKIFIDAKIVTEENTDRFSLTLKLNEISSTSGDLNVTLSMYNPNEINKEMFNATGEFKIKSNVEIKSLDVENAKSLKDLTSADQQKFMNALETPMSLISSSE